MSFSPHSPKGREEDLWPSATPPYEREDFRRLDETDDALFYDTPKVMCCAGFGSVCACLFTNTCTHAHAWGL